VSPRIKASTPALPRHRGRIFRLRPRIWLGLLCLVCLGFATHLLWQRTAPIIAQHPQYLLAAENIEITPSPPWIRSDIKAEVLRDGGLAGTVSLLDPWDELSRRVQDAFEFHPWIASVERIRKRPPSSLEVEVKYRRPIAAVEVGDADGVAFLPIDEHAIRLPERDLSDAQRRYLPRISGITDRPLVGDAWDDPRVIGGAKLAAALTDVWQQLRLVEILSRIRPDAADEHPSYTYELVTTGGTRIVWGAAPGQEALAGELPLDQKRRLLQDYAAQHGRLESIDGPARLDVRSDLIVTPRTARNKIKNGAGDATQTK